MRFIPRTRNRRGAASAPPALRSATDDEFSGLGAETVDFLEYADINWSDELPTALRAARKNFIAGRQSISATEGRPIGSPISRYAVSSAELVTYFAECIEYIKKWPDQQGVLDCSRLKIVGNVEFTCTGTKNLIFINFSGSTLDTLMFKGFRGDPDRGWRFQLVDAHVSCIELMDACLYKLEILRSVVNRFTVVKSRLESFTFRESVLQSMLQIEDSAIGELELGASKFPHGLHIRRCVHHLASFNYAKIDRALTFDTVLFFFSPAFFDAELTANITFKNTHISIFDEDRRRFRSSVIALGMDWLSNAASGHDPGLRRMLPYRASDDISGVSRAARALRLAMKKAGAHWEEARFFAVELRADRRDPGTDLTSVDRAISLIYDVVSRYGTSPVHAVATFIAWNLAFIVVVSTLMEASPYIRAMEIPTGFGTILGLPPGALVANVPLFRDYEAVGFVLQSAFNPLAIFSSSPAIKINSFWLAALSLVQSLGTLGIAALAVLSLRTRFQRGGGS